MTFVVIGSFFEIDWKKLCYPVRLRIEKVNNL